MIPADVDAAVAGLVRAHAPALYLLLDAERRVVEANEHTRALLGVHALGVPIADLVASFERAGLDAALSPGGEAPRLLNFRTFTGLPQSFLCWMTPVGDHLALLGGVDPQEQEALRRDLLRANQQLSASARELSQANAELSRLSRVRDTFFGMAAHDLRQPLTSILWLSELLLDEPDSMSEDVRGQVQSIRTSADLMLGVVRGFLQMALIAAGRLRIEPAPASLREVVEKALVVVRPAAQRKRIALHLAPAGDLRLPLDEPKIEQVVVNLVKNAVEHSEPGAEVWIDACADGDAALIAVRDRGAGIPPEVRASLFKAYTGAGHHKTAGERSTGLGLAISRMIVEAHGGRIDVQTAAGEGTTLCVRIPLAP